MTEAADGIHVEIRLEDQNEEAPRSVSNNNIVERVLNVHDQEENRGSGRQVADGDDIAAEVAVPRQDNPLW